MWTRHEGHVIDGLDDDQVTDTAYLSRTWMGLRWSAWMPLMAAHPLALAQLPSERGLYRVRRVDRRDQLEWIGWAGRGVREVVERLSRQIHLPVEPFDDPHSPALALWSLHTGSGASFEVSGAAQLVCDEDGRAAAQRLQEVYRLATMRRDGRKK